MEPWIKENISLKNFTTFRIGGPARYFCAASELGQLIEAVSWAKAKNQRIFILGGGSNILFSDEGFDGLVIHMKNDQCRAAEKENSDGLRIITCQAGVTMAALGGFALENGLSGLEWAAGLPGTVGGAIRGNAGAFGGEIKDNLRLVRAFSLKQANANKQANAGEEVDPASLVKTFSPEECVFAYRSSFFKSDPEWIIWEAEFAMEQADPAAIKQRILDIIGKRHTKQPDLVRVGSAGSAFKNPVAPQPLIREFESDKELKWPGDTVPAGWLIERCGLKGKRIGGAGVDEKHANFIINDGTATAKDVLMLISVIKQKVRSHFKIQLQEEIEIVL